jgi:LysR family transcriptional regulator, cell division regulator
MTTPTTDLRYFIEVASSLSLSRAAERLGLSQPALSLAMRRLEDSTGTSLLIRNKSGVRLTRAGRKFSQSARYLVSEWERVHADLLKGEQEVGGRYTIGCHPAIGVYSAPLFVPRMIEQFPKLELTFLHDVSPKITDDIIQFKMDFGLVINPVEHPDLVVRELLKDEVTFWTSRSKRFAGKEAQDPTSSEAVLIYSSEMRQVDSLLIQAKKRGWKFRRRIASSSLELIRTLVACGVGVGILPRRVAEQSDSEIRALLKAPVFEDRVCLIYRADAQRTATSRILATAMGEAFR